jgi:hypothetical protein
MAVAAWHMGLPRHQALRVERDVKPFYQTLPICGPGLGYDEVDPGSESPVVLPSLAAAVAEALHLTGLRWAVNLVPAAERVYRRGTLTFSIVLRGQHGVPGEERVVPLNDLARMLGQSFLVTARIKGCSWIVLPADPGGEGFDVTVCINARSDPAVLAVQVVTADSSYPASNVMAVGVPLVARLVIPQLPDVDLGVMLAEAFSAVEVPPRDASGAGVTWLVSAGPAEVLVHQLPPHAYTRTVNESCPILSTFQMRHTVGLGHRFLNYAEALRFAELWGATYLHTPSFAVHSHQHGAYPWFERLLPLAHGELPVQATLERFAPRAVHLVDWTSRSPEDWGPLSPCGTLLVTNESRCPATVECPALEGMLDDARGLVRTRLAAGAGGTGVGTEGPGELIFDPRAVNVAWHLRVGDVTFQGGRSAYFRRIKRLVDDVVSRGCPGKPEGSLAYAPVPRVRSPGEPRHGPGPALLLRRGPAG